MTLQTPFERQLIRHEGLKLSPYHDTEGILTIGVGHNLERGISESIAMAMLREDIQVHAEEMEQVFPITTRLDEPRYYVLLNMCFNMGCTRMKGFKRMWKAVEGEDWGQAAVEMLDSKWSRQVGRRSHELADIMKTGIWRE